MAPTDPAGEFERLLQHDCAGRFRAAALLTIIAFAVFAYLDPQPGDSASAVSVLRTVIIAALLLILGSSYAGWGSRHLWVIAWLGGAVIGAGVVLITALGGGVTSPGHEGLLLLFFAAGLVAPMSPWFLAALFGLQLVGYNLALVVTGGTEPAHLWLLNDAVLAAGAGLGLLAGISLRRVRLAEMALGDELLRISHADALTQLLNRRYFVERLEGELLRAQRTGASLCLVMLDVDHFKQINDDNGHEVGDAVLRTIGEIIAATLRRTDLGGRYGGEEFAICLTDTTVAGALEFADRLRRAVSATVVNAPNGDLTMTISVGVAQLRDRDASVSELVRAADEALYQAKRRGRNRVVTAVPA